MVAILGPVVIYDSVLFQRTGLVGRWANSLERRFVLNAKEAAPKRSGELAGLISGSTDLVPPAKQALVTIVSNAPHSLYVLKGTTGPIMSNRLWAFRARTGLDLPRGGRNPKTGAPNLAALHKKGYALRLPAGYGFPGKLALSVSGQEANNFLARAAEMTAVTNPSLRGFSPEFRY